jgi:hypothetical protein
MCGHLYLCNIISIRLAGAVVVLGYTIIMIKLLARAVARVDELVIRKLDIVAIEH